MPGLGVVLAGVALGVLAAAAFHVKPAPRPAAPDAEAPAAPAPPKPAAPKPRPAKAAPPQTPAPAGPAMPPIRYVVILKSNGISPLSVAEVEVIDSLGHNIAAHGLTHQTSDRDAHTSDKAVDLSLDTYAETQQGDVDQIRRWTLDLERPVADIVKVRIHNRRDKFIDYLNHATLLLQDEKHRVVALMPLTAARFQQFLRPQMEASYAANVREAYATPPAAAVSAWMLE